MTDSETGGRTITSGEDPLSEPLEDDSYDDSDEDMENDTPKNEEEKENSDETKSEKTGKSKDLESALAQKKHYREKLEKAERELEELKSKMTPKEGKKLSNLEPMSVVRLAKALGDYTEDEVEFITRNAKGDNPEDIIEASKDEWVQSAITSRREKVAKERQTPDPSSPSVGSRKVSFDKLKDMDDKQFREFFNKQKNRRANRAGV